MAERRMPSLMSVPLFALSTSVSLCYGSGVRSEALATEVSARGVSVSCDFSMVHGFPRQWSVIGKRG